MRACKDYVQTDPNNETATFEQAQTDLDELVDYACMRFGQEKVIIVGHLYGTMLGSQYVLEHPGKVAAYIGEGIASPYLVSAPEKNFRLIDGCGHSPQYDDPEEFCSELKNMLDGYIK